MKKWENEEMGKLRLKSERNNRSRSHSRSDFYDGFGRI